jgi:hypothetical protein
MIIAVRWAMAGFILAWRWNRKVVIGAWIVLAIVGTVINAAKPAPASSLSAASPARVGCYWTTKFPTTFAACPPGIPNGSTIVTETDTDYIYRLP